VTGSPPFLGTTTAAIAAIVADATPRPREVRPEVPEGLERAILTALAKSPLDRFPNAQALAAALMPFASAEGIAGPFSLRPSEEAFAIASSTMARVPSGQHANDASDLLRLPTSRATLRVPPEGSASDAICTFFGSLAVGFALAAGVAIATRHTEPRRAPTAHTAETGVAVAGDTLADAAPLHSPPAPSDARGEGGASAASTRGPGLAVAARPRPVAPPGAPPATPRTTTSASPQHERTAPSHALPDRPLFL
jgi:serine/threonine-protein kinase